LKLKLSFGDATMARSSTYKVKPSTEMRKGHSGGALFAETFESEGKDHQDFRGERDAMLSV